MECKAGRAGVLPGELCVLIETLWNVKLDGVQSVEPTKSFNRNIVECKVQKRMERFGSGMGFNRNIVECKVYKTSEKFKNAVVLIETLWNVK